MVWRILLILTLLREIIGAAEVQVDFTGSSAAPGHAHICVINQRNNNDEIGGQVKCWGDGSKSSDHWLDTPKDETFVQVIAGESYGCGLNLEQMVLCWGGLGKVNVRGMYTQITGGDLYGCGVMTDASIKCWGSLHVLPPEGNRFIHIDCHKKHCCALNTDNVPECFGKLDVGDTEAVHLTSPVDNTRKLTETEGSEEEDGYEDGEEMPEEDVLRHKFSSLATGDRFSCGIELEGRNVQCWGEGKHSRGNGVPMHIPGPFKQISMHNLGLCGIYGPPNGPDDPKEHSMKCWGQRMIGVVSKEEVDEEEWDQVTVSKHSVCAVSMTSELVCWGSGKEIMNQPAGIVVA
jgi:hypothetical protein